MDVLYIVSMGLFVIGIGYLGWVVIGLKKENEQLWEAINRLGERTIDNY